jgi:hypothetical protein
LDSTAQRLEKSLLIVQQIVRASRAMAWTNYARIQPTGYF